MAVDAGELRLRLDPKDIGSAQQFFEEYVVTRLPVSDLLRHCRRRHSAPSSPLSTHSPADLSLQALIASHSPDLAHLSHLWTDEYLIRKAVSCWPATMSPRPGVCAAGLLPATGASLLCQPTPPSTVQGAAQLQVEERGGAGEGFGKGRRRPMTLAEALRRMSGGDDRLYLTTQPVAPAADGHPRLYASPVAELAHDIPLVPLLAGRLVPQGINLWMGAAAVAAAAGRQDGGGGSSSRLHTDFHDNLYVLLRGRKRVRLFPPSAAHRMHTVGRVAAVHPNGRIVFEGQVGVQGRGRGKGRGGGACR